MFFSFSHGSTQVLHLKTCMNKYLKSSNTVAITLWFPSLFQLCIQVKHICDCILRADWLIYPCVLALFTVHFIVYTVCNFLLRHEKFIFLQMIITSLLLPLLLFSLFLHVSDFIPSGLFWFTGSRSVTR